LTIEGYSVLHQMAKVRWAAWRALSGAERENIVAEAVPALERMEQNSSGQSALYSLLGHKGDLMVVHFRESFDALNQAELDLSGHAPSSLHLLLPHGPPSRRRQELVHPADGGAPTPDEPARHGGTPLRWRGQTNHFRLNRLRRLGMGCHPVRG